MDLVEFKLYGERGKFQPKMRKLELDPTDSNQLRLYQTSGKKNAYLEETELIQSIHLLRIIG